RRGIVRRVYHFVPMAAWPEVQAKLRGDARFTAVDGTFVFPMEEGRLVVTTVENAPAFPEPVLAIVNPTSWSGPELEHLGHVLRDHGIETDLALVISPTEFVFPGRG
ncbi:MAG TPA: hypothetical protein VLT61_05075, partial [Anaeromyxobacteraceae bacterium]|nr:hypothetical protein [Anaeromyxobacteraceae bacterium]